MEYDRFYTHNIEIIDEYIKVTVIGKADLDYFITMIEEKRVCITQISSLTIEDVQIDSVPEQIDRLTNLYMIVFSSCPHLHTINLHVPRLRRIYIRNCNNITHISSLSTEIEMDFESCDILPLLSRTDIDMHFVRILRLASCDGFINSSIGLYRFHNLVSLAIIDCNNYTRVPDSIANMTSLVDIRFYGIPITSISSSIAALNLRYLELYMCMMFTGFEEGTVLPRTLRRLDFISCMIEYLPKIDHLDMLVDLHIGRCPVLKALPQTIGCLMSLKLLHIYELNITYLPQSIHRLHGLAYLSIQKCDNLLAYPIQRACTKMESLTDVFITGNMNLVSIKGLRIRLHSHITLEVEDNPKLIDDMKQPISSHRNVYNGRIEYKYQLF